MFLFALEYREKLERCLQDADKPSNSFPYVLSRRLILFLSDPGDPDGDLECDQI